MQKKASRASKGYLATKTGLRQKTQWLLPSTLGLAVLLVVSYPHLQPPQLPELVVECASDSLKPGDVVSLHFFIKGLPADPAEAWDFHMYLPEELGAVFVPGSFRVYEKSLNGAYLSPYSGKEFLEVRQLHGAHDSVRFMASVSIPYDAGLAGRDYSLRYTFSQKNRAEEIIPVGNAQSLSIRIPAFELSHKRIGKDSKRKKWYEIVVKNPTNGFHYNRQGGFLTVLGTHHNPFAKIGEIKLIGDILSEKQVFQSGNTFTIEDLDLSPGQDMVIRYACILPRKNTTKTSKESLVTAFVPLTIIRKAQKTHS